MDENLKKARGAKGYVKGGRGGSKRPRTPVEEAEQYNKLRSEEKQRELIHERVIKEIPAEVEKSVQNILDTQLIKLKKEMDFQ